MRHENLGNFIIRTFTGLDSRRNLVKNRAVGMHNTKRPRYESFPLLTATGFAPPDDYDYILASVRALSILDSPTFARLDNVLLCSANAHQTQRDIPHTSFSVLQAHADDRFKYYEIANTLAHTLPHRSVALSRELDAAVHKICEVGDGITAWRVEQEARLLAIL